MSSFSDPQPSSHILVSTLPTLRIITFPTPYYISLPLASTFHCCYGQTICWHPMQVSATFLTVLRSSVDNSIFLALQSHIFTLGQLTISQSILILSSNLISVIYWLISKKPQQIFLLSTTTKHSVGPTQPPIQRALGICPSGKGARSWYWPLASTYCQGCEWEELYLSSPHMPSRCEQGQLIHLTVYVMDFIFKAWGSCITYQNM
jgi:hypothetical protein